MYHPLDDDRNYMPTQRLLIGANKEFNIPANNGKNAVIFAMANFSESWTWSQWTLWHKARLKHLSLAEYFD